MMPSIEFIYSGGAVKRYHTVQMIKEDSVAQHSFGVAWFCYLLSGGGPSATLLIAAMAHDLAEQYTGDLPSPAKRQLKIGAQFRQYEQEIEQNNGVRCLLSTEETRILKLADCMDGAARCAIELSMGNTHAKIIFERYISYVYEIGLVDSEIFLIAELYKLTGELYAKGQ